MKQTNYQTTLKEVRKALGTTGIKRKKIKNNIFKCFGKDMHTFKMIVVERKAVNKLTISDVKGIDVIATLSHKRAKFHFTINGLVKRIKKDSK